MPDLKHEGCERRRYAGQLPRAVSNAVSCHLNLDLGLSGSASSGVSTGALQFGDVTINTGVAGSTGGGSTTSMTTIALIGAAIVAVIYFIFRKK